MTASVLMIVSIIMTIVSIMTRALLSLALVITIVCVIVIFFASGYYQECSNILSLLGIVNMIAIIVAVVVSKLCDMS